MRANVPKGMGGGPQNMNAMIRQAQKMQEDMEALQADLDAREYDISAGGGAVGVKINGKREILSIDIKPEIVDPDDIEMLSDILLADVIHMDDFFLPLGLRNEKRFQTPGGNVHYERFFDEVVCNLKTSTNFSYTKFDCSLMDYNGHIDISVGKFIIVEGSYSHHPYFKKYADLTVFLDVDKKEQGKRILERNGEVLYKKFKEIWIPLEEEYFFEYNIKNSADIYLI